ncbi:hypothetical protein AS149_12930 [Burkholderia cenocepacia]|nr:hypothetical protein AS149_12930 [Burkholderia cenocepacia]
MPSAVHSAENRKSARAAVLDWAGEARQWREGWGNSIPDKAYDGYPFDASDEGVHLQVRSDRESRLWCFSVEHDDARESARHWRLEAFVADRGTHDELGVRVFCQPGEAVKFVPSSTPALVKTFIRDNQLVDAGCPVTARVVDAGDDDSFTDFVDLLLSRERRLPLVVLTQGRDSRHDGYAVNPEQCARVLQGFAHVVALPEEQSFWLTDELGKTVSAYGGAVRTYNPGFHAEADPYDHPLLLQERIEEGTGPRAFEQVLARKLRAATVGSPAMLELWPEAPVVDDVATVTRLRGREGFAEGFRKMLGAFKRS